MNGIRQKLGKYIGNGKPHKKYTRTIPSKLLKNSPTLPSTRFNSDGFRLCKVNWCSYSAFWQAFHSYSPFKTTRISVCRQENMCILLARQTVERGIWPKDESGASHLRGMVNLKAWNFNAISGTRLNDFKPTLRSFHSSFRYFHFLPLSSEYHHNNYLLFKFNFSKSVIVLYGSAEGRRKIFSGNRVTLYRMTK